MIFNRKHVSLLLVLLLLGAQLALAHHASVHFSAHGHIELEDGHDDHDPQARERCEQCIFAKSLAHALGAGDVTIKNVLQAKKFQLAVPETLYANRTFRPYRARAPPAFLS